MSGRNTKYLKKEKMLSLQTDPHPGFRGRKELRDRNKELSARGVCEGDIIADKPPHKYIAVLLRGILIFFGAYGTVWGLAGSFGLAYDPVKVFVWILVMAIISASVYYNRATFYIGYITMFISFFVFSVLMYSYINSGFQAFLNEMNQHYVDYFSLPAARVSEEVIADRSLSVPIACIFMGWVYCIMLNVTISSYMNPALTFLVTFIPLQAAFYIDITPSYLCMTMLIMCYASVLVLSRAGYYALPYRYKKYEIYSRRRRRKGADDSYILSARGMLSVFGISVILSLVFFVVSGAVFGDSYSTKYISNRLKNKTDEYVEVLVMNGLTSMFNRYDATGGLAHGRLGGIGSVTPDYETDLIVTYAPETSETVYLRAFVGDKYYVDRFTEDTNVFGEGGYEPFHMTGEPVEMEIENVGADPGYYYLPYHSINAVGDKDGTSYITYVPSHQDVFYETDDVGMLKYSEFVFDNYTYIPESLIPILDETVDKAGMVNDDRTYHGILYSCSRLEQYFAENYRYSLQPGRTPYGRDVVEYFLSSQDRGYCMHYASASTLLLRYIGIPARYCEGYALTANQLAGGELIEDENGERKVRVELSDAMAHAWVEVYIPGYGWIPYEMTPPSFGDDDEIPMNGIMGILSGLFNAATRDEAGADSDLAEGVEAGASTFRKVFDSIEFLIKPLGFTVVAVILLLLLIPFIKNAVMLLKISRMKKNGNYSDALLVRYRSYVKKLSGSKLIGSANVDSTCLAQKLTDALKTLTESGGYDDLSEHLDDISSKAGYVGHTVRRAAFSADNISDSEYRETCLAMKDVLKALRTVRVKKAKTLQKNVETV
ncbi:MAG: transglutaminase domain-containing protein [Lachnospiraceae bacterium]|nr:transglutaminase domain-containing protein [Lachnospiraceae bacterium]